MSGVGSAGTPPPDAEVGTPEPAIAPGALEPGRARGSGSVGSFLGHRLGAGIVTLLVASFLIFLATNALPGNVAQAVLGKHATPQVVRIITAELHLNRPLMVRYGDWLAGMTHGDLGKSAVAVADGATKASVASLIRTPLYNSFILAAITLTLLIPLSLLVGTVAAVREGRATDYAVSYVSLVLSALPEFVLGTLLILVFFSVLNLLSPVALVPPGSSPLDNLSSLILPVLTLLGVLVAFSARQVRAGVIGAMRQNYVTMARLSGLPERRVLWRYALRNALAPTVQTFAQTIEYLFGGMIVVEALYDYPGIGQLLVQAVSARDVTMVQGITIVLAVIYIVANIVADLIVVFLVPKLRTGLR
jgi:peptide/nickel transport system permease protein